MNVLAAPLHLLALVLVISGLQKVAVPGPATQAIRDARLPTVLPGAAAGVALGVVEAGVGLLAIGIPEWWTAAALGAVYLAFAGFVVRLRHEDADAGCGCFGAASTPPGRAHLALDLAGATVGVAAAVVGAADIVEVVGDGFWVASSYLILLATGAALLLLGPALSSELARARAGSPAPAFAIRPTGGRPTPETDR